MRGLFNFNLIYLLMIAAQIAVIVFLCLWLPACLPVAVAVGAVWTINLFSASALCFAEGSAEIKCSALLLIMALPVIGAIICMCAITRKQRRGKLFVEAIQHTGDELAIQVLCGTGGAGYEKAVYFNSGEQYFDLLFKEISRAKERVYLEYFIVKRGEIFNALIAAVRTARQNGAEVKFIIDGIGSALRLSRRDVNLLRATGAEVKIFNKLKPTFYTGLNNRDHRKIAVIDGRVAFTGGINIGDEYANIISPLGHWKDTGIAVYGRSAEVFEGIFLSVWNKGYSTKIHDEGQARCMIYYDSPPRISGIAQTIYISAISAAKRRVHIFTPYLCAGEGINNALTFAAGRGVDVKIIIPHVPDKKYAFELSQLNAQKLAGSGVDIYEYMPGFMHAKAMICDDRLFIGTHNFDFRSLHLNYECGIAFDGEMCECAEKDFEGCLNLSSPLKFKKILPAQKICRFFLKLFAPLF